MAKANSVQTGQSTSVASTLVDKLWNEHVVDETAGGRSLLFIDRHLIHDGSFHAFNRLKEKQVGVAHPELCLATPDHYVPTQARSVVSIKDAAIVRVLNDFDVNTHDNGIRAFALDDPRQGIVHVVGPEQGFTLPGMTLVCGDSHTSTHGALGALAFGIGASEVAHVLATQCSWQQRPRGMRIHVDGILRAGVYSKDLALFIIASIGSAGATGCAVEFCGPAITALSVEARCTLCNLSIEAGARAGLVAPDEITFRYLEGRPFSPRGQDWQAAIQYWKTLRTDPDARFDADIRIDASCIKPMTTWGTSPNQAIAIDGHVPGLSNAGSSTEAESTRAALDYMGLTAGQAIGDIDIDQVFIGSCANARIEDLRIVAATMQEISGSVKLPTWISPGSSIVKRIAEEEGIADIFLRAGAQWRESGCSMCVGMNGDVVGAGMRCVSTSNRNFAGRQGRGSRTHLVSPATAAATAMFGRLRSAPN
jgi:3-isopropylmalate/(R)-2-methylmalate dehydratase large subunit